MSSRVSAEGIVKVLNNRPYDQPDHRIVQGALRPACSESLRCTERASHYWSLKDMRRIVIDLRRSVSLANTDMFRF
jgi:hypothetical protein